MATFEPNPNNKDPWIERAAFDGYEFRVWHVIFFCFSSITFLIIFICCCVKIRVPRTKQEIEADYQRKKIASKFRKKLKLIQNNEMDAMDLKRALEIIQEDLQNENKNIDEQLTMRNNSISNNENNFEKNLLNFEQNLKINPDEQQRKGSFNREITKQIP